MRSKHAAADDVDFYGNCPGAVDQHLGGVIATDLDVAVAPLPGIARRTETALKP